MVTKLSTADRVAGFCAQYGLRVPILVAPMAGASPPLLSIAAGNAGAMGACGVLLMQPDEIRQWARDVRAGTAAPFQLNVWIRDPAPVRDREHEGRVRQFLSAWGPPVP